MTVGLPILLPLLVLVPAASVPSQQDLPTVHQEPLYQGKPLHYWAQRAVSRKWFEVKEALDVLAQAGAAATAAVPVLMRRGR